MTLQIRLGTGVEPMRAQELIPRGWGPSVCAGPSAWRAVEARNLPLKVCPDPA